MENLDGIVKINDIPYTLLTPSQKWEKEKKEMIEWTPFYGLYKSIRRNLDGESRFNNPVSEGLYLVALSAYNLLPVLAAEVIMNHILK